MEVWEAAEKPEDLASEIAEVHFQRNF